MKLHICGLSAIAALALALAPGQSRAANLVPLVSFNGTDGEGPSAGLIADASGNLFGTAAYGGAYNQGTVFEITKTAAGYASTPTTLVSFCSLANYADGALPRGGLTADANGNLFGTTSEGGVNNLGTVFEIAKTANGYASTPTTLVNFNGTDGGSPLAGLIAAAACSAFRHVTKISHAKRRQTRQHGAAGCLSGCHLYFARRVSFLSCADTSDGERRFQSVAPAR